MYEIDSLAILNDHYDKFVSAIKANNISLLKESLQSTNSYENLFLNEYDSRKKEGVYFTNEEISDFIVNRTLLNLINKKLVNQELFTERFQKLEELYELDRDLKLKIRDQLVNSSICDPACGSGVFLIRCAKILFSILIKLDSSIDINELKMKILNNLFGFDINEYAHKLCIMKLYDWSFTEEETNLMNSFSILNKNMQLKNSIISPIKQKFDIIIGNPPYGNILSKEEKQILKKENIFYHDIYCAFLLKSLNWSIGTIGFLIPKSFLLRQGYIKFRNELLSQANINEIFDLGSNLFKKATNEVQIVIYGKKEGKDYTDLRIYDFPDKEIIVYKNQNVDSLKICQNSSCPLSQKSKKLFVYSFETSCPYCKSKMVDMNRIRIKPENESFEIIKKIEKSGNLNYLNPRDFPKMVRGEEDKGLKQVREKIEKNISNSCLFINAKDDFQYYQIKKNKSFNIEEISADNLKGKNYEYYKGPKLLIKHNNIIPEAAFITEDVCFTSSIYSLLHKDSEELKYLCAVFNSALIQFYCKYGINNQKDTTINLNQYMIRHLPIIKPTTEIKFNLSDKVDLIIKLVEENNGIFNQKVKNLLIDIDKTIFEMYKLTEIEQNVIIDNIINSIDHFNQIYNK